MSVGYLPGVFDCLHTGHVSIIRKAQRSCDRLIIGIHTDEFAESYKRRPIDNAERRKHILQERLCLPQCDVVLVGGSHLQIIQENKVSIFFHGDDWAEEAYKSQIRYKEDGLDRYQLTFCFLQYTKGISTTQILKCDTNLDNIEAVYFDLDNTLVLNGETTEFAIECMEFLDKLGIPRKIITNNNRFTPVQIHDNLKKIGLQFKVEDIHSSLDHVIEILQRDYANKRVFAWGTHDALAYMKQKNIHVTESDVDVIVVLYRDNFQYTDLVDLCTKIQNIPYVVGNIDTTYPDKDHTVPDTGSIVALLKAATGVSPTTFCGKPTMVVPDAPAHVLYIGDSETTDRPFATNNGYQCLILGSDIGHLGVLIDLLQNSNIIQVEC
jgi:cytidyltransferase-like protein